MVDTATVMACIVENFLSESYPVSMPTAYPNGYRWPLQCFRGAEGVKPITKQQITTSSNMDFNFIVVGTLVAIHTRGRGHRRFFTPAFLHLKRCYGFVERGHLQIPIPRGDIAWITNPVYILRF